MEHTELKKKKKCDMIHVPGKLCHSPVYADKAHIEVEFRHMEEFEEILKIAMAAKEVTA